MSSHTSNQIIPDSFDEILPETIIGNISEKNIKGVGELQLDHTNELSEDARKNRVGILEYVSCTAVELKSDLWSLPLARDGTNGFSAHFESS